MNMDCYGCNKKLEKMIEGTKSWLGVTEDMHEMRLYCPSCFERYFGKPNWKKIMARYKGRQK